MRVTHKVLAPACILYTHVISFTPVECAINAFHYSRNLRSLQVAAPSPASAPTEVPTSEPDPITTDVPRAAPTEVPTSEPDPMFDSVSSVPSDVASDSPSISDAAPNTPGASPPTSIAPTVARDIMAGESPPVNGSTNNTGIILGAVVGVVMVGILLLAAIAYVNRPHTPVPPPAAAANPAASPATGDTPPVAPTAEVPSAASVIPSAIAAPIMDSGHNVLYKDQCRSVTELSPALTAASPPVARVAEPTSGGSKIPFAVAVAMAPSSAVRPPRDP